MNTSPSSMLSKPRGSERIPVSTLSYFRTRNKRRLYSLVISEFKNSKLSQADLARRLGKQSDVVCRWLAAPGNWQLDTVSDLLFAINGAEAGYSVEHPLSKPPRNDTVPTWLTYEPPQPDISLKGIDFNEVASRSEAGSSDTIGPDTFLTITHQE